MTEKAQQKIRGFWDMQQPMSKTQPGKASEPSKGDMIGRKNTEHRDMNKGEHDFNYKAKVTNPGGNYMEFGKSQAGLGFNGQDKDASISYLQDRNKKGQEVRNFSGGQLVSKLHTKNGGVTAYNGMPINEVYKSTTDHETPPAGGVTYPASIKNEVNDGGNQTKLGKQLRDKKK